MEMFPKQMDAAVLTSSFATLKSAETLSIKLFTVDKSVNLPISPKHKAPLIQLSFPGPDSLAKKSCQKVAFFAPLTAI